MICPIWRLGDKMLTNNYVEVERDYIGNFVEFIIDGKGKVSGLLNRINLNKRGVKIKNKWYSIKRVLPCREKGELELVEKDDTMPTPEPYIEVTYRNV